LKGEIPTILNVGGVSPRTAAVGAVGGLTIKGSNFTPQSLVWFTATGIPGGNGGIVAPVQTFVNSGEIKVTVPTTATAGPVRVTNAAGVSSLSAEDWAAGVPQMAQPTSLSVATGPVGTTVIITGGNYNGSYGAGFSPYSKVFFTKVGGGMVEGANFSYISFNQVKANVPANAAIGPVYVTNAAGTSAGSVQYFVPFSATNIVPVPTITSIPSAAVIGELITVNGTNFTPQSAVGFNNSATSTAPGLAGTTYYISSTQLKAIVPATALTGTIYVSNASGNAESTGNITITAGKPIITSAFVGSAAAGPTGTPGSSTLTVSGANFGSVAGNITVNFTGGVSATAATVSGTGGTTLTVVVPAGAQTGPFTVTTTAGTSQPSPVYFAAAGSTPTVTSVTPSTGPGGTVVTVIGSGFTPQSQVKFGAVGTAIVGSNLNTFISSTELRVAVPISTVLVPTTVTVTVSTASGTGATSTFSATGPDFIIQPVP